MEKEIIELLKTLAGSTETLVIWYMVLSLVKTIVEAAALIACCYWFGRGVRGAAIALKDF